MEFAADRPAKYRLEAALRRSDPVAALASLSRYEAAEGRNQIMGLLLRRSAAPN
jgi:hypothetical protein